MPTPSPNTRIFRLLVVLEATRPAIWRRLEVVSAMTLPWLHCSVDLAMGWPGLPAHRFLVRGQAYGAGWGTAADPQRPEGSRRLDRLGLEPGSTFRYRHDLGTEWQHRITLEQVEPPRPGVAYPRLTGGDRACPPEWAETPDDLATLLLPEHPALVLARFERTGESDWEPREFFLERASQRFARVLRARIYA